MDSSFDTQTGCALCLARATLRVSHIAPHFVWKWLKDSSATGFLRTTEQPNKSVQDGFKIPLLCEHCEQRLSAWGKLFSEEVFCPFKEDRLNKRIYGDWLLKFSVSLSWRILLFHSINRALSHVPDDLLPAVTQSLEVWRRFLVGEIDNPRRHEQHLILCSGVSKSTLPGTPENINRYLLRTIDTSVVSSKVSVITYANLCGVLIVGFVAPTRRKEWINTKVHLQKGTLYRKTDYQAPSKFAELIKDRARLAGNINLSDAQQAKQMNRAERNIERFESSATLRAIQLDLDLSKSD
jgi:hypothetical protein